MNRGETQPSLVGWGVVSLLSAHARARGLAEGALQGVAWRLRELAAAWDSRVHGQSGAGKRSTYRICARELRALADDIERGLAADKASRDLATSNPTSEGVRSAAKETT